MEEAVKKNNAAIICAAYTVASIMFLTWCNGYNFDKRGDAAFWCAGLCIAFGTLVFFGVRDCWEERP